MKLAKLLALSAVAASLAVLPAHRAEAQLSIRIGPAPACPYGYFDYSPYNCAPYGYYGPQWFNSGLFIGAGPWFHGPRGFHGYVNQRFDPRYGYHGGYPRRGEHAWRHGEDRSYRGFHGNQWSDGHGHYGGGDHRDDHHGGDHHDDHHDDHHGH